MNYLNPTWMEKKVLQFTKWWLNVRPSRTRFGIVRPWVSELADDIFHIRRVCFTNVSSDFTRIRTHHNNKSFHMIYCTEAIKNKIRVENGSDYTNGFFTDSEKDLLQIAWNMALIRHNAEATKQRNIEILKKEIEDE